MISTLFFIAVSSGALAVGGLTWSAANWFFEKPGRLAFLPTDLKTQEILKSPKVQFLLGLATALGSLFLFPPWVSLVPACASLLPASRLVGILRNGFREKKRKEALRDLFPQALGMAVQALKTGQTVPQVLEYLSKESSTPIKEEWGLACAEMGLGSSTDQALAQTCDRNKDLPEFGQFLESYRISRSTGANLAQLLQILLEGLEEKNRITRKMDAMTAQARLSGLLMGLLPFLLVFIFFVMDPTLIQPLFTERIGWAILGLAAFLETIGFLWIRQLLRVEV